MKIFIRHTRSFFSAGRIGTTEDELYFYRQRGDSIIGNQTGAPGIDIEEALWERIVFFKERDSAAYGEAIIAYISNVSLIKKAIRQKKVIISCEKSEILNSHMNEVFTKLKECHYIRFWKKMKLTIKTKM